MLSHFSHVQLFATLLTVACQAPLTMGILQTRILEEWVAISSSRGSSNPGIKPRSLMSPALAGRFFTTSATWDAHLDCISSVQFSHSVVSDSLQPYESQHARPPCPSPTPRACSNSCPSCWWCHPTLLSSVVPLSSCLQSRLWEADILECLIMCFSRDTPKVYECEK